MHRIALWIFAALPVLAAGLEISRPARPWEFVDANGEKASILGAENGTLEAFVYPLKIFKDLRLLFIVDGREMPAEALSRRVVATPGSFTILYAGDEFEVRETLIAPLHEAGALIRLSVHAWQPLRIDAVFTRDFQLMWPASFGTSYDDWDVRRRGFVFGADGYPYAAFFGSPDAALVTSGFLTDYYSEHSNRITLGTVNGQAQRVLAFAASMKSKDEALATYDRLVAAPDRFALEAEDFYRGYLDKGVRLELPDQRLQQAYDWSRVSIRKGMVDNPLLGRGLVAGYGPSKGVYRPGYAWFFGRDSFWSSLALDLDGDLESARTAIAFVSRFQRADGKLPHEISQSASLTRWFEDYPYGYASADSTPLFIIAVRDYVEASGDIAFAREQWPRLAKALAFMRSTLDADGFPANLGVGTGWVEGGPLLPVRVELYQAGCYVEALRALAKLAEINGDSKLSRSLLDEFRVSRAKLDAKFWLPQTNSYAFALGTNGAPVDRPSVLATVPMWFGVLDEGHSQAMIERLAAEDHSSDWGMRIVSSKSPIYGPAGYHFGSVWPLFTGWASVGEYEAHQAQAAGANLRANAWLALDGAGGNTTEVLSGAAYSELSTSSPHQTWSAAMVVAPLLRGLLGLRVDATKPALAFEPHLPADWNHLAVRNLAFPSGSVDLVLDRDDRSLRLAISNRGTRPLDLIFSPAYAPCTRVTNAALNGKKIIWNAEKHGADWHPRLNASIDPGENTLILQHEGMFGYVVSSAPLELGATSSALKILSERWSSSGDEVELTVEGRQGREYDLALYGSRRPSPSIAISIPPGDPSAYGRQTLKIRLKP